ncbi:MAG: PIN domain nuclease [Clostridiales bacterium]|nr:PIN domain nuclease [Clostridiales bacterium]
MDIMLDSNVIISAALFPNDRINSFIDNISEHHRLFLCSYGLEELNIVIKRKFSNRMKCMELFLHKLQFTMIHTPAVDILDYDITIRDKTDYPLLLSAIIGDVDIFITGDKDFSVLDLERPEIMTITEFVNKYM